MSTLEALSKEKNGWSRHAWKSVLNILTTAKQNAYNSKGNGNKARRRAKQLQSS